MNYIVTIALQHGKIPALTEIGQDRLADPNWHTRTMINPLKYDSLNRYIAYGVTWRNEGTSHFHVPYPGHYTVPDFLAFHKDPFILFEKYLPEMFAAPKKNNANFTFEKPEIVTQESTWHQNDFSINNWKKIMRLSAME